MNKRIIIGLISISFGLNAQNNELKSIDTNYLDKTVSPKEDFLRNSRLFFFSNASAAAFGWPK